jgi:hypothetical protein
MIGLSFICDQIHNKKILIIWPHIAILLKSDLSKVKVGHLLYCKQSKRGLGAPKFLFIHYDVAII